MKAAIRFAGILILGGALVLGGCARKHAVEFVKNPDIRAQLKSFAAAKESQAQLLASAAGVELPAEAKSFFSAIQNANWEEATNDYAEMRERGTSEAYQKSWRVPAQETYGAAEQFSLGDPKYDTDYGNEIIQSIPEGSIYFGGTDPGRFIITAMQQSQPEGEPFFTLTQNALADGTYLDYLRSMYGDKISIPTAEDSQKCFDDYYKDVQERMAKGQLQPGENVKTGPGGKLQVTGQVAVMQINGLLVKDIFEKNTKQDFYIEESFPLEWMYPYLEPHGLIFKINRETLSSLPDAVVQQDHDYWTKTVSPMIGDWLADDTSVGDIGSFAEKIYLKHDFRDFTGDTNFVENEYAHKMFSKERSSTRTGLLVLAALLVFCMCGTRGFTSWKYIKNPALAQQLKTFVAEEEAKDHDNTNPIPRKIKRFFTSAKKGNWLAVSNIPTQEDMNRCLDEVQREIEEQTGKQGQFYDPRRINELFTQVVFDKNTNRDFYVEEPYNIKWIFSHLQPHGLIFKINREPTAVLPESIVQQNDDYWTKIISPMIGGWLNEKTSVAQVAAFAEKIFLQHDYKGFNGDRNFVQNIDTGRMFSDERIATAELYVSREESQECFQEYSDDAKKRLESHQLKQGERVKIGPDGKVAISGRVAVMAINGLLAKVIFDKNPNEDFYVEESFPLDWMYPYLEPHGLIFKINRQPLDELPEDVIQADHDYWTKSVSPMIGDWLNDNTSVADVVAFAKKVFVRHDYSGFTGDRQFVENRYVSGAFSWERFDIARLYVWRMKQASGADEKERMWT